MGYVAAVAPRTAFLIGASGAGKSTLARQLARRCPAVCCLHFDEIIGELGLWADGEAEAWQRGATLEWCRRIARLPAAHVLLDGQTRHAFAAEGCAAASIEQWQMVLIHCGPEARAARLQARGEPELNQPQMLAWADWLLRDAQGHNMPILDTTELSIESASEQLEELLGLTRAR